MRFPEELDFWGEDSPSWGLGIAGLGFFFPFQEWLVHLRLRGGWDASNPVFFWMLGSELRVGTVCVPCSAPPGISQHLWVQTPQIPGRRCQGQCPLSSHTFHVLLLLLLLPLDWDEPEAAEKAPREEILSWNLKGKNRMSFVCTPRVWGAGGSPGDTPTLGLDPSGDGVMTPGLGQRPQVQLGFLPLPCSGGDSQPLFPSGINPGKIWELGGAPDPWGEPSQPSPPQALTNGQRVPSVQRVPSSGQ